MIRQSFSLIVRYKQDTGLEMSLLCKHFSRLSIVYIARYVYISDIAYMLIILWLNTSNQFILVVKYESFCQRMVISNLCKYNTWALFT